MYRWQGIRMIYNMRSVLMLSAAVFACSIPHEGWSNTRSYGHIQSATYTTAGPTSPAAIQSPGQSAVTQAVVIPFSKSTVVELPQDMMDVIVSNPEIVEAVVHTSTRVVLIGKRPGQTNAYFYGQGGRELLSLEIRVERDISGLNTLISQHVADAHVTAEAINDNILLTGSIKNASMAKRVESLAELWLDENTGAAVEGRVLNLMSIEGKDQVLLKVRIVEMQRSVTKQLGINLNAVGQLGDSTVSLISNNALGQGGGAGLTGSVNFANTGGGDLTSLGGILTALERVGLVRTKAEPTLAAISGETANFLAGAELPFLTDVFVDDQGRVQQEFEYRNVGVSLGFTPVVLSEGRISLNISTEVSELTTEGAFETGGLSSDIQGRSIRRANTVVELPAGGSLMIAGLVREESRQTTEGVPGAKDIPLLGAAFRSRDDINTQTELVVIVTPYLADPTHPEVLQTPLDGFVPASDTGALFLGRLNEKYKDKGVSIEADGLPGTFGYVVD